MSLGQGTQVLTHDTLRFIKDLIFTKVSILAAVFSSAEDAFTPAILAGRHILSKSVPCGEGSEGVTLCTSATHSGWPVFPPYSLPLIPFHPNSSLLLKT